MPKKCRAGEMRVDGHCVKACISEKGIAPCSQNRIPATFNRENPSTKVFEADGYMKLVTEDDYEKGEVGKYSDYGNSHEHFSAPTQEALIKKLMDFAGVDNKDAVLINSCDEEGRVDIQSLENGEGYAASKSEIERWKKGEIKLWAATYTFSVEVVGRQVAKLKANPTI